MIYYIDNVFMTEKQQQPEEQFNFNSWKKVPLDIRRQPSKSVKFNRQSYHPIETL